jgi:polyferredoxin
MRTLVQTLSLLLFSALFAFATYRLPNWIPADLYLRLDPLLGLTSVLAAREIIGRVLWSLLLVGATFVAGRFFCGYICPLGVCTDFLDRVFFRGKKRPALRSEAGFRRVKFFLLFIFVAAAITGVSLAFFLDPISLLTRVYTFLVYPLLITLLNLFLDLVRPLSQELGWVRLSHRHYVQPAYYMSVVIFLFFGVIIALNRWAPRFWCRFLCPLGAFLALIAPLSLLKRRVSTGCNACLKCQKACPMGAVEAEPTGTNLLECIQCRTCARVCPQKAVTFSASSISGRRYGTFDLSRRTFFYSVAGGLAAGFLTVRTPFALRQGRHQLIRPPGAIPEAEFLKTCIRCGECMKSCLTNTLQPCFWESGLSGLWTPKLDLRLAGCEQNCNVCGKVCPTQAIRSLSMEEKNHAKIGTAVLRKDACLVWAQNKICLICDEICPYNAIVFRPVDGLRRPVVIASRCNGCGLCEQRCPVQGESAIAVVPNGEIRLREGSYIAEARKLQLEFKPDPGDDRFLFDGSEGGSDQKREDGGLTPGSEKDRPQKPKGFL